MIDRRRVGKKGIGGWIYGQTHRNRTGKKKRTGDGEMKNDRHKNIYGGQEEISEGEKKRNERKNCTREKETKKE
jgi:hypothetical protein